MRIGQTDLINRVMEKIDMKPTFQVGKVYHVELVKADSKGVLLKYMGRQLRAKLQGDNQAFPKTNTPINVRVQSVQDGEIIMKLLPENHQPMGKLNVQDLKNLLTGQGLAPSQDNVNIVEKLIKHKLPVTTENIKNVLHGIEDSQGQGGLKRDMAVFLMERKLPFHPVLVGILGGYFKKKDGFSNHMEKLMEGDEDIREGLKGYVLSVDGEEEVPLENKIMETLQKFQQVKEQKKDLFEAMERIFGEREESMDKDLKKFFKHITFQSMINRPGNHEAPYIYYQIPIKWKESYEAMEIFILPDGNSKNEFSMKSVRTVFSIYTEEMGQIKVDVAMDQGELDLKIGLENQPVAAFIEGYIPILEDGLKKMDFQLKPIRCFVDQQDTFQYIESLMEFPHKKIDGWA